jgi:hypothetical protein
LLGIPKCFQPCCFSLVNLNQLCCRLISMVQFNPHSIIQADNGERYDVTSSPASTRYPFLDHEGDRDDFIRIVESYSLSIITYNPSSDGLI